MADKSLKDLNYGHPGVASYDLENRGWAFARNYKKRIFKQILIPTTSSSTRNHATPKTAPPFSLKTPVNRTSIQDEFSNTVQDDPLLAPATEIIPDLALVSAAISSAASTYDPLVSGLLSFGSITPRGRDEAWQMAALPTGETGSILQLCILDDETHGWTTEPRPWVRGQTLKAAESAFWNEEAAPIQQVCFARSEEKRPLLAVRLPTRTVLFHPDYVRQPRAAAISPFYRLPASTIQPNRILSIHHPPISTPTRLPMSMLPLTRTFNYSLRWSTKAKRGVYGISSIGLGLADIRLHACSAERSMSRMTETQLAKMAGRGFSGSPMLRP